MEIWVPLISACVGGLIATVPVLIGLAVQIYLHMSERRQKEREAKIQVVEQSLGRDMDKVMDLLSRLINIISERDSYDFRETILKKQKEKGIISDDEYKRLVNLHIESIGSKTLELETITDSIGGLIYSFDDEIKSRFEELLKAINSYLKTEAEKAYLAINEKSEDVIREAGYLQRTLREKKISIRDTIK